MSEVFFTDRDLGKRFPDILSAAGLRVERHADHFAPNAPDEEWLEHVGRNDWIALTHDGRIRYKPNEQAAVLKHKVRLLVVIGKAPFPDLAQAFVQTVPRVRAFLAAHEPPFIAKVFRGPQAQGDGEPATGRVELWYPR